MQNNLKRICTDYGVKVYLAHSSENNNICTWIIAIVMKAYLLRMKICFLDRFMYSTELDKSPMKIFCVQCNLPWVKTAGGGGVDFLKTSF